VKQSIPQVPRRARDTAVEKMQNLPKRLATPSRGS